MANDPGHWLCHRTLGAGAFGVVQLWRNDYTNEMIAIKKCKSDGALLTEKQKERWINEVRTMNSLQHSNIVGTRSVPSQLCKLQDPLPVLCMEYCSRGDLRTVLNRISNCCGVEEREALRIMNHVASAVEYLHSRNFTHRDLKPENIVIQGTGEKTTYKLTDLGYVCELGETTVDRSVVGTLNYLAPELLWKDGYTCSVDYWSLGILFYEIVTGNRPFFPDMHVTPKWIGLVKRKGKEHICAREEDGKVLFSAEIENPTTISDCIRDQLTNWFVVALQWDPKSRGKIRNDQGIDKLVVWSLLKSLLSWKILYVFVVSLYRIDSYAVKPEISVRELQFLIRDKTGIDLSNQLLSDSECNVLSEPSSLVLDCTQDSYLVLFQKDGPRVDEIPSPSISLPIRRMIAEPQKSLDHETLRRYYGSAVFFVSQELKLFRSYVIALSINIDLSNMALEELRENVKILTTSTNNLTTELAAFAQTPEYGRMREELRESLSTTRSKTQKLVELKEEVTSKIDRLTNNFEDLKTFSETDWLQDWTRMYERATGYLEATTRVNRTQPCSPVEMVKLLYGALKLHSEQLRHPNLNTIVNRIKEFDRSIMQLKGGLNSFQGLADRYRKNYEEIVTKGGIEEQNSCLEFIDSMTPNDNVIFDNIVLRHLIDSLDDFHQSLEDMEDIDI